MWFRQSATSRWHRCRDEEQESMCGRVTRPLDYVHAQRAAEARHGQRAGAPERNEATCAACAKLSGFRRRVPRRVHIEQDELVEALEDVVKRAEALLASVRGDVR